MENPPSIHLHIDRLILDGLPFGGADAGSIQDALETELARVLGDNFTSLPATSAAVERLPMAQLTLDLASPPAAFGGTLAGVLGNSLAAAFAPPSSGPDL